MSPRETEEDGLATASNEADPEKAQAAPEASDAKPVSGWQRTESTLRMVSILAVTVSAATASWQYLESRLEKKREKSVDFIQSWQDAEERDAYARLQKAVEPLVEKMGPVDQNASPEDALNKKLGAGCWLVTVGTYDANQVYETWEADVDSLVQFYSQIDFCVEAELCEPKILTQYFEREVVTFWEYFRPYAMYRRDNFYPDYGDAIDGLVTTFSGWDPSSHSCEGSNGDN